MPENTNITVTFRANTVQIDDSLSSMNAAMGLLKTEAQNLNKALKLDPTNTEKLNQVITNLKEQQKLLNRELEEFKKDQEGLSTGSQKWVNLQKRIESTQKALDNVEAKLEKMKTWKADQINKQFEELSKKIKKVSDGFGNISQALAPLSTAAAGALGAIAYEAINFESAFTGVAKTVDATDEELAVLREGLLELATVTPATAEEIAGIAEAAGQLGIAKDDILAFSETMAGLSSATNLTADEAATMIAQFANVVDIEGQYEQFGSALVDLGNNGASTEKEIMELAQRLSGAGSVAGMSAQEILGLAASMANVGINAEAGGTAMSTLISQFEKASVQGGEALEALASVSKMTAQEFAEAWSEEPSVAIDAFLAGLNEIQQSGGDVYGTLENLGITEKRLTDTVLRLSSASGEVAKNTEMANEAWKENSALQAEVDKRNKTTASMLQNLKDSFTQLADSLGQIVLPFINNIVAGLQSFVNWLTNLSPAMQGVVLGATAFVAGLAPMFSALQGITSAVSSVIGILGTSGLAGALSTVALPITAAVAAFAALWASSEQFRQGITALANQIIQSLQPVLTTLQVVLDVVWRTLETYLFPAVQKLGDFLAQYIIPIISQLWNWISSFIVPIIQALANLIGNSLHTVIETISNLLEDLINILTVIFDWLEDIWNWLGDLGVWEAFGEVLNAIQGFIQGVIDVLQSMFDWLGKVTSAIGDFLSAAAEIGGNILGGIGDIAGGIWDGITGVFSSGGYQSGGFASGGAINLTTNINVNTSREITQSDVRGWAIQMADVINEELGRRL